MAEAYIVDAVRSPVGKRGGSLSGIHPADLGAHSLKALVERTGIDPGAIDDVIIGATDTIGGQSGNVGRSAVLVAGFPEHVPGVTIDRQCGSSQQAVHFAAQAVMSGRERPGDRGWAAEHVAAADLVGHGRRRGLRVHDAVRRVARLAGTLPRPGDLAVRRRRDDRREVGHLPRGDGAVRAGEPPACGSRPGRGPLRERDRPR